MKMIWHPDAVSELKQRYGIDADKWRLVYDTEGCGCAVNGVPALWAVDEPTDRDIEAESSPFRLWHDPNHSVFFDELLRVSYDKDKRSFTLASDGQIYTSRLVLADHRDIAPVERRE